MGEWPFPLASALFQHLNRYTPVKPLKSGAGGPEHLYIALESETRRRVVVKLLQEDPSIPPDVYLRYRQLLIRSGATLSKLHHPNIVATYDFGASADGVFVVMEYLEGGSLEQKLTSFGALEPVDVVSIARGLVAAIDYAHETGVVHCDVRPGRILLDAAGKPRLTGFSSARSPGATSLGGGVSLPASPVYAAPEQLQGNIVPATDQFALAAVLYRAVTGRRPFRSTELVGLIRQILTETPEPPSRVRTTLPRAADAVFLKALSRNPDDRFRDCAQFLEALESAFGMRRWRWLSSATPDALGEWVQKLRAGR